MALHDEVQLAGVDYSIVSNSNVRVGSADLKVFQISGAPTASNVVLNTDPVADLSAESAFVGWGLGKGSENAGIGWDWGGVATIDQRWGTNTTSANALLSTTAGTTIVLETLFNSDQGDNEAALTLGDSGGGLFQWIDNEWKLSGIGHGVSTSNSSSYAPTPDGSYYGRVANYASAIYAIIPEPSTGTLLVLSGVAAALFRRRR